MTPEERLTNLEAAVATLTNAVNTNQADMLNRDNATGEWVTNISNQYDVQFQTLNEEIERLKSLIPGA